MTDARQITHLREITSLIGAGKRLVFHPGVSEPQFIGRQIAEEPDLWPDLTIETFLPASPGSYLGKMGINIETAMPGPHLRHAVAAGQVRINRETMFEQAQAFARDGRHVDLLVLQVSPPDKQDRVSLGPSVCAIPQILSQRPLIMGVINPRIPRTNAVMPLKQLDVVLEHDAGLPSTPVSEVHPADRKIADNVMSLLSDDITVEVGIGATPDAIMAALVAIRSLRIHTGLISDAVIPLVENGTITGPVTATLAQGSARLFDWLDQNDRVQFLLSLHTHDVRYIGSLPRFHAINTALQVDLTGHVNAERIAGRVISCPGGLPDFARGARLSHGGRNIIVLRSTAGHTGKSTIVQQVDFKTLDGSLVDTVVTENGIAELTGLNDADRAQAILSIAHPDHQQLHTG